jgi:serine-type D-Ala-D-Ala carboxypeptidase/endopeptidase
MGIEDVLADLATHTSGLPGLPKGMLRLALKERHNPYANFGIDGLHAAVTDATLRRPSGKRVRYSNFGFGLLGHVLALRTGQSYEELVSERILRPLGMTDTMISVPVEKAHRFAQGHSRRGRAVSNWDLPSLAGAGALRSTVARGQPHTAIWHDGGTGGFRSVAGFVEDADVAVVVLSNSSRAVDTIGLNVLREVLYA